MYRTLLAERIIPAPNPDDRHGGGAEACHIFEAAEQVKVEVAGPGELSDQSLRMAGGDGATYTERAWWLVDSEGGYHRIPTTNMDADGFMPFGGTPMTVVGVLRAHRGEEIVAIVRAYLFGVVATQKVETRSATWFTRPPAGWPL